MAERRVFKVVEAHQTYEGAGFPVRRSFPVPGFEQFDPFLLLDEMGPVDWAPGEALGAPDHPHRGFETVTYMLAGGMRHKDSHGFIGEIRPGDVQWMTAGAGVVHSELPAPDLQANGGLMHGLQLWVNLPKRDKMTTPRYQDIRSDKIPEVTLADGHGKVRVVAGASQGVSAVAETRTPILYVHFLLEPGARVVQQVPSDHRAFLYTIDGRGRVDGTDLRSGTSGLLTDDGDALTLEVPEDAEGTWSVLLIGGVPIREPVARWGPFVMNDFDEIRQAMLDYQTGRFGTIEPIDRSP